MAAEQHPSLERKEMMLRRNWIITLVVLSLLTFSFAVRAQEATPEATVSPADLADPDGQFVEVNGAQVYYVERGPADGPAVLLLHGFLGSTVDWTPTIDVLADAGYRTIAFDRPPFGLSDKSTQLDYSLAAQADLTIGLMDTLDIDTAVLVGHSAGGPVVANAALRYPDRVTKLVIVAGAIGLRAEDAFANESSSRTPAGAFNMLANLDPDSAQAQKLIRGFFNADFADNLLKTAYYDPSRIDPDRLELSSRGMKVPGWEGGLLAYAQAMSKDMDATDLDALKAIPIPVLLMWGEEDQIVPISVGERLRDVFPDNIWKTYPRTGHIPMDEATDTFNSDILEFLGS
jgi:pimeloyl-ACP methyl ester carboxylesterase